MPLDTCLLMGDPREVVFARKKSMRTSAREESGLDRLAPTAPFRKQMISRDKPFITV